MEIGKEGNILTSENLLFLIEAEKEKIKNEENTEELENKKDDSPVKNIENVSINLNLSTNKNSQKDELIDEDEEEEEQKEEVDNRQPQNQITPEANKNVNKKTKKTSDNEKVSFGTKLKKIVPFIGLGILVFVLIIVLTVAFSEPNANKITAENVPYPTNEKVYKEEVVIQEKETSVKGDKDYLLEDSESLQKRRELYKREELKKSNTENPLPELDNNSSKKNEPTVKVVKDTVGFKQPENRQTDKNFVVLNEKKAGNEMENPNAETKPITTSSTKNINETQNEIYEEELRKAEIEKENLRAENLRLEQEKSEREKELEKQLAEIQLAKKEQSIKETLIYKAKTKEVAINLFLINSNMAFLGGSLYTEPTINVNKKVYTASFNDIEGKYYNIEGTTNYISVKQLEDNYLLENNN